LLVVFVEIVREKGMARSGHDRHRRPVVLRARFALFVALRVVAVFFDRGFGFAFLVFDDVTAPRAASASDCS
jgi:hypothetical protein